MPPFTCWLLVDGQQRMTTLMLMLAALRDHIRKTQWKGDEDGPTAKRIDAYFLKNLEEEGTRRHKLVLRRHDQQTLLTGNKATESARLVPTYDQVKDLWSDAYEGKSTISPEDTLFVRHQTTRRWEDEFMAFGIDTRDPPPDSRPVVYISRLEEIVPAVEEGFESEVPTFIHVPTLSFGIESAKRRMEEGEKIG